MSEWGKSEEDFEGFGASGLVVKMCLSRWWNIVRTGEYSKDLVGNLER